MPKHKKPPTKFISDDEGEVETKQVNNAHVSESEDEAPPAPQHKPGHLKRVYTLKSDDDNEDVPIKPKKNREPKPTQNTVSVHERVQANITELVAILTKSNANLKGKIDDTGRFELEFEKTAEPATTKCPCQFYESHQTSLSSSPSSSRSSNEPRKVKHGRTLGWTK